MCCVINTDTLIANLLTKGTNAVSDVDLGQFLSYLTKNIPGRVVSDLSEEAVWLSGETFPDLFVVEAREDGIVVSRGEAPIQLEFFMGKYSSPMAERIEQMAEDFLAEHDAKQSA